MHFDAIAIDGGDFSAHEVVAVARLLLLLHSSRNGDEGIAAVVLPDGALLAVLLSFCIDDVVDAAEAVAVAIVELCVRLDGDAKGIFADHLTVATHRILDDKCRHAHRIGGFNGAHIVVVTIGRCAAMGEVVDVGTVPFHHRPVRQGD